MKADPYGPDLQAKYFGDLFRIQLLHIVEDQDHSQRCWQSQNSLMQQLALLAVNGSLLRAIPLFEQETCEFVIIRNQLIKGELLPVSFEVASSHSVAAVARDGIQPGSQSARTFKLVEMLKRSKEDFLRGVLCI